MIRAFWNCGDNQIIEFAIHRARLNKRESDVLRLVLDECKTQEQAAEILDISTRNLQNVWYSACNKILSIDWVIVYAKELLKR